MADTTPSMEASQLEQPLGPRERTELDHWFRYHPPKGNQAQRYELIRAKAAEFAELLYSIAPPSADRTVAIRRIREAVMCANASIACYDSHGNIKIPAKFLPPTDEPPAEPIIGRIETGTMQPDDRKA